MPAYIKGPMKLGEMFIFLEGKPRYELHLPQGMEFEAMTTIRQLFETFFIFLTQASRYGWLFGTKQSSD